MKLEDKSKKRARKQNIQRAILTSLALVGGLPVALVAPNVFVALEKVGLMPRPRLNFSVQRAQRNLLRRKLICVRDGRLELTKAGEGALLHFERAGSLTDKPRRWDGRWRVLIFDIPEKLRHTRRRIRQSLLLVGFTKLQHSVWVYPYDSEEFVALLKTELRVGKDLLYLIVDSLEGDAKLRRHFGLPSE